jgi:hypothetical protein
VDECIGLAVIALNEAEALHRVEELDRAGRLLASQLAATAAASATRAACRTLGARAAILDGQGLAFDLEVGRRNAAAAIDEGEAQRLTLGQAGQACLLDRADVHEHVLAAIVANDEAEALLSVEELYDAGAFTDDLGGHAATATAAATEPAAAAATETTAAAAEAATTAEAATAAAISTAAAAAIAATAAEATAAEISTAAAKVVTAEIVAFVTAATTTIATATFIETHALFVFPVRPVSHSRTNASDDRRRPSDANQ